MLLIIYNAKPVLFHSKQCYHCWLFMLSFFISFFLSMAFGGNKISGFTQYPMWQTRIIFAIFIEQFLFTWNIYNKQVICRYRSTEPQLG